MSCGFCGGETSVHESGRDVCVTCQKMTDSCICWHPDYDKKSNTIKVKEKA